MAEKWLKGRKDICGHMNVCWETVRKWVRDYGCPIHVMPGGRPVALPSELDRWIASFGGAGPRRMERQGGDEEAKKSS